MSLFFPLFILYYLFCPVLQLRALGGAVPRSDADPNKVLQDVDWDQDDPVDAAYSSVIRRGAQTLPTSICRG